MKNSDEPATGITVTRGKGNYEETSIHYGLTKREAFAMAAMQGLLASDLNHDWSHGAIATMAIEQANEILKELDK